MARLLNSRPQERKLQLNVFETLTVPEDINGVNYGGGCIEVSYK